MEPVATSQLLANYAEIVSAVAVVISLVYLAIQLRMNTKALKANAAWDLEVVYGNANVDTARDPIFAALFARANDAHANIADFTEAETAQLYFAVRSALQFAQAQWWLWKNGSLPDELWAYRSRWARNFIEAPVIKTIWQAELQQHVFAEQFTADILSVEQEGELSLAPREG
jgi:hypothetical protein